LFLEAEKLSGTEIPRDKNSPSGDKNSPSGDKNSPGQKLPGTKIPRKKIPPPPPPEKVQVLYGPFENRIKPVDFLCDKFETKLCGAIWGPGYVDSLLRTVLRNTLRADKFRNQWLLRNGRWCKISKRVLDSAFSQVLQYHELVLETIDVKNVTEFNLVSGKPALDARKWVRAKNIKLAELTPVVFRRFLEEVHAELGPLRGLLRV
jgi:hypothetical protein